MRRRSMQSTKQGRGDEKLDLLTSLRPWVLIVTTFPERIPFTYDK